VPSKGPEFDHPSTVAAATLVGKRMGDGTVRAALE
jgi:hypothetical protein